MKETLWQEMKRIWLEAFPEIEKRKKDRNMLKYAVASKAVMTIPNEPRHPWIDVKLNLNA